MGNFEDSRVAKVTAAVLAMVVTTFCAWLLLVWAPALTFSPQADPTAGSLGFSAAPESAGRFDGSASRPLTPTIVVLGDTFTAGRPGGAPAKDVWPAQLCQEAGCQYDPSFAEAGSGFVARGLRGTRFGDRVDDVIAARPAVVVVAGGASDKGAPEKLVKGQVSDVLDRLSSGLPAARILVFSPFWRQAPIPPEIRTLRETLRDQARARGLTFVDVTRIFVSGGHDLVAADGAPTHTGQEKIAETVRQAVYDGVQQGVAYPGG